ncbi:MAG: alpha/beta hydrolase domain-containing protein, partial [Gammaproteobacteria bacterium]|nr:alpha/beta hydrolase domain-containing protein [Gammaproteobacteria bacterium]
ISMRGFSRWLPPTEAARAASGDPRVAIEQRYANRDDYLARVREDVGVLVEAGYVLAEDAELVVTNALERYDLAVSKPGAWMHRQNLLFAEHSQRKAQ